MALNSAEPTTNESVEIFLKTLTGGFSCINKRLAFDTELYYRIQNRTKTISKKIMITKFVTN